MLWCWLGLAGCQSPTNQHVSAGGDAAVRIVSLKGPFTETLFALGLGGQVVGVDITSTYPEEAAQLPKAGRSRQVSAEGVLSLGADWVVADRELLSAEVQTQLESAGLHCLLLEQVFSPAGTKDMIQQLATQFHANRAATDSLLHTIDNDIAQLRPLLQTPKVLFVYARGAGNLMVGGQNTAADAMITLSGGQNAIQGIEGFRPLTAESLVEANPDAILLFDTGLESLEGPEGLMALPGMSLTRAGKERRFVAMDGNYLLGFGPRLGKAALELNQRWQALFQPQQP